MHRLCWVFKPDCAWLQGVGQKFNSYAAAQFEVIMARVQQDAEAAGRTAAAEGLVSACSKLSASASLQLWRCCLPDAFDMQCWPGSATAAVTA